MSNSLVYRQYLINKNYNVVEVRSGMKLIEKTNIWNPYNQVAHLTQGTIWGNEKKNTTHKSMTKTNTNHI